MEKIKIKISSIMFVILVFGYFLLPQTVIAREYTHTVKKGDTLWDICEQYYGDSSLWPKLWEMNSFITNPHLLDPGDVITLFQEEEKEPEIVEPTPEPVEEPEPPIMGVRLKSLGNLETLGYYSFDEINQLGSVFASKDRKVLLEQGDIVYVIFEEGTRVSAGDLFTVGKSSSLIVNPYNKKEKGYIFSASGTMVIEKSTGYSYRDEQLYDKDNVYQAKILQANMQVDINDILVPHMDLPDCILPVSNEKDILGNIMARDDKALIHQYDIVYLNKGANDGVRAGNVFNILKEHIVIDPKPGKDGSFLFKDILILPDDILGKILILETKPETAAAIVLSSTKSISKGAFAKNISWTEIPDFIAAIADCPID